MAQICLSTGHDLINLGICVNCFYQTGDVPFGVALCCVIFVIVLFVVLQISFGIWHLLFLHMPIGSGSGWFEHLLCVASVI